MSEIKQLVIMILIAMIISFSPFFGYLIPYIIYPFYKLLEFIGGIFDENRNN